MNFLKLPLTLLLTISLLATSVAGQQKRRTTEKTAAKPPAAPAPAPATFDTLLSADSYKVYAEIRGVGQFIKSNAVNEVLDPILKFDKPDEQFADFINWLKSHAEPLMTSRLLVAAWPTFKDVPDAVVAIEFSSPEEAAKFEPQLNGIMPTILPPMPQAPPEPQKQPEAQSAASEKRHADEKPAANEKPKEPVLVPRYHLQRSGSLVLVSDKPIDLKKLHPAGTRLLSEDPNFRVAYNRFTSEPIFVFLDFQAIEKESREREKQVQEEMEAQRVLMEKQKAEAQATPEAEAGPEIMPEGELTEEEQVAVAKASLESSTPDAERKEEIETPPMAFAFFALEQSLFTGQPNMPDAIGIGFSPENESFDVRVLLVDSAGETSDPIPVFLQGLKFGSPIAPQSASVLPSDSELVLTLSLDFQQMHARLASAPAGPVVMTLNTSKTVGAAEALGSPLKTIEKTLKINIKDDLLPLLGSEVAVSLPLSEFDIIGPPRNAPQPQPKEDEKDAKAAARAPVFVVSLRDKEGMRRLMPKILEGFAGKAAAALAQTERRDDAEIVSIANSFAYAFVGDFLVIGTEPASIRHVVDSYVKGETLAADPQFKNSTRWQPQAIQAQGYMSAAVMERYKSWANNPNTRVNEEVRALMARLTATVQPVTYSLSNDGLGTLHELHVPKNLVLLAIAGSAAGDNPPESVKNERMAMTTLWAISNGERQHKEKNNSSYGSLEELIAGNLVSKDNLEANGYKFDVSLTAAGFEATAVPTEYGKSGKLSFFIDQTGIIRGGDHNGAAASASDQPVRY